MKCPDHIRAELLLLGFEYWAARPPGHNKDRLWVTKPVSIPTDDEAAVVIIQSAEWDPTRQEATVYIEGWDSIGPIRDLAEHDLRKFEGPDWQDVLDYAKQLMEKYRDNTTTQS